MDPNELTEKWLALSVLGSFDRRDPFLRLITAWLAFNSLYSSVFEGEGGDRRQIRAFVEDASAAFAHARLLEKSPPYLNAIAVLQEQGVRDVRRDGRQEIEDPADLMQVLMCVYQVRCNLFHGGKHPQNPRDRALAQAAFVVTASLVSMHYTGRILEDRILGESAPGDYFPGNPELGAEDAI